MVTWEFDPGLMLGVRVGIEVVLESYIANLGLMDVLNLTTFPLPLQSY